MPDCNDFSEISVLIPGYSIEDLPTDLPEDDASSLLNAIACAWHPLLLARTTGIPVFRQAESLSGAPGRRIILVPKVSEGWMPHEWRSVLKAQGHLILDGCGDRIEWLAAIRSLVFTLESQDSSLTAGTESASPAVTPPVEACTSPVLEQDFLALGIVDLQVRLLSRRRHHFVDPDTLLLSREACAAARASLDQAEETTRGHLTRCFEHLRETREKFFPLDSYLLDLCIPGERCDPVQLMSLLESPTPVSLFATGRDLALWFEQRPGFRAELAAALLRRKLALLSGQYTESRLSLGTLTFAIADLARCHRLLTSVDRTVAFHHARRRFGLTASLPSLLTFFTFESALHVALDDGIYPDRERSQFDWQAPDGSVIAACSRIPLAIDSASSFLKFADRCNESLQDDTVPALFLARLPELRSPWLTDLQIAAGYAPVLGEFVTPSALVHVTEGRRQPECHQHQEYLSPFLIQSTVLKSEPPVSGPALIRRLQQRWLSLRTLQALLLVAGGQSHAESDSESSDPLLPLAGNIADLEFLLADSLTTWQDKSADCLRSASGLSQQLAAEEQRALTELQQRIPSRASEARGLFIVNSLPFARTVKIAWPQTFSRPAASSCIEELELCDSGCELLTRLPPGGFCWLQESSVTAPPQPERLRIRGEPLLAEPLTLRNRHFEVLLNEQSGGIASVAFHGKRGNRISQQVCFRFERELSVKSEADGTTRKVAYADCRLLRHDVVRSGTVFATVRTTMELRSPADDSVLAVVHQETSVNRSQPRIHLRIEFESVRKMPSGNPWLCYFGCRFAWDNELAAITRSVMGHAAGFRSERIETSDYLEISDPDQRVSIVPNGRPWHRRSGPRMLDSLLIVEGEPERAFEFTLEFDQAFPLRFASDVLTPVVQFATRQTAPASLASAWLLGLSAKNIHLVDAQFETASADSGDSGRRLLRLRLTETEGTTVQCDVRTARKPISAWSSAGPHSHQTPREVTDSGTRVPIGPWQIVDVVLQF